eukprot:7386643-Prymnesium_polylepis.1
MNTSLHKVCVRLVCDASAPALAPTISSRPLSQRAYTHQLFVLSPSQYLAFTIVGAVISISSGLAAFWIVRGLRSSIHSRDNLDGDDCTDCCLSFWCNSCVQCLILRYETKGKYELCSNTGD